MIKEKKGINCAIFQTAEAVIRDVKDKINRAKREEKARFAERLKEEVNPLLSCPEYNGKNLNCLNCRFIANACKRTADIIIKAGGLARRVSCLNKWHTP